MHRLFLSCCIRHFLFTWLLMAPLERALFPFSGNSRKVWFSGKAAFQGGMKTDAVWVEHRKGAMSSWPDTLSLNGQQALCLVQSMGAYRTDKAT